MNRNRPTVPLVRGALSAAGVLAVAALIWFVGPLVAVAGVVPLAGEPARWAAIAAVALAVAAYTGWRVSRDAWRNRRLMEGLVAAAQPSASAPGAKEVAVIGRRFEQAVTLLRRSRVGGRRPWFAALAGRPFVYELPWYIIIGAPGAGKTTALVNSGLEFPLADAVGQKVIRGIGGTRHCDWWFASDAVLIDTAGRYTTHDSDRAADRAAWLGFLELLVRYRPRRPINGVLLTLSVADLLSANPERRQAHAGELRERIEELHTHLGIAFPVYVLVTKCDLLAGFMEFFADFDRDERSQVWGVTFPYEPGVAGDGPLSRMASEFAALEKRLNDCLLDRLHAERDRERRAAVYGFPQQWRLLRQTLADVLQAMLGDLRPELRSCVRGVYFTSATQEGTPMDRALGGLARALGLSSRIIAASRPSGKTFFVTRLLREVVFAEAGLAGTNLRWQRRRAWLEWGVAGMALFTLVTASALVWRAYAAQREQVAEVAASMPALQEQASAAGATPPADLVPVLPVLDTLASMAGADARQPVIDDVGLDSGEMLGAAAADAYGRTLREAFLPRIATRLEQRLRAGDPAHVALVYDTLKAYLMLFGGRHYDAHALRAYLHADWDATLPPAVRPAQREALRRHLDRLLASGEVGAPAQADPQLVAAVRSLVASVPPAQRSYERLKQMDLGPDVAAFSLETAAGGSAQRVFLRADGQPLAGVPALYTRAAWRRAVPERTQEVLRQFAAEASWVLDTADPLTADPAARRVLAGEVQALYRADYEARWAGLIGDLRLAPTATLAATGELAGLLARPDSPLAGLLRAVVREVSVEGDKVMAPRFEPLQQFVMGQPAPMDELQALLGKLSAHLAAVDDAQRRSAVPPASDVQRELMAAAQRAPEPVRGLVSELAQRSSTQVFAAIREPLARQVAGELGPDCLRAVAGRYPLSRAAAQEVSREAFARTFAAGGLVDGFFQRHLAPHVDTAARPWTWRTAGQGGEGLQPFQQAQAIREAYFREGGRQLGSRLEFRLIDADADVAEFALDIDGQALRFKPGSRDAQAVLWPGPGRGRVVLRMVRAGEDAGPGFEFEGPWALLRLLDRVRIEPGATPDRVRLVFDVQGRRARFEVRSASPQNPLLRRELEQFQCPSRL